MFDDFKDKINSKIYSNDFETLGYSLKYPMELSFIMMSLLNGNFDLSTLSAVADFNFKDYINDPKKCLPYLCLANHNFNKQSNKTGRKYQNINKRYTSVIDNFNNLCDDLSFEDVISVSALFTYMALNGYLSIDKNLKKENSTDYYNIIAANLINGHAVCRHFSFMLADILKGRGFEAAPIAGFAEQGKFHFDLLGMKDMDAREMFRYIVEHSYISQQGDEALAKLFEDKIYRNVYYGCDGLTHETTNHKDLIAMENGFVHVIDSFNDFYMKKDSESGDDRILTNGFGFSMAIYNEEDKSTLKMLDNPMTNRYKDFEKRCKARNIILGNVELLEKFYTDNSDSYDYIYNKTKQYCKKI